MKNLRRLSTGSVACSRTEGAYSVPHDLADGNMDIFVVMPKDAPWRVVQPHGRFTESTAAPWRAGQPHGGASGARRLLAPSV